MLDLWEFKAILSTLGMQVPRQQFDVYSQVTAPGPLCPTQFT